MTFEAISVRFLILEITINFKLVDFKQSNVGLTSYQAMSFKIFFMLNSTEQEIYPSHLLAG